MEDVEIDGSQGEGGGQILRTAVAFAVIRGVPVNVVNIRAGREQPGLKRQHVSALKVMASVFGGRVEGVTEGSGTVRFVPGKTRLPEYSLDMGTAASITLVLQAVIPAVALGGSGLRLSLTGGTDVPWSPTFDYFQSVVIAGYRALGIEASLNALRRGYYPRGGGVVSAEVRKCTAVHPLNMTTRGKITSARIASRCGSLPPEVAERQANAASARLERSGIHVIENSVTKELASSPGTSVAISSVGDGFFIGSDAIGSRGRPAEAVGAEAAEKFVVAQDSGACMDANVADMLIPLLSMAPGPSRVRIPGVTPHLESGLRLARRFVQFAWSVEEDSTGAVVGITPETH